MAQWLNWGDGSDGSPNAISGTINTYAACTGTSGQTVLTTTLSAGAGDQVLVHQSQHATAAGTWEIVKIVSDAGATLNLEKALVNSYSTGAQAVLIPQYTGGDISGAVTGTAWNGTVGGIIALMSNGSLTVSGSLSANAIGFRGGVSINSPPSTGQQGEGNLAAGGTLSTSANGSGGGGGADASPDTTPGGGGNGASGSAGGNGGTGGLLTGNAGLTTALFGGGGGGAWTGPGLSSGKGGGFVVIFAKNLTITGTVSATGGNGASGSGESGPAGGAGGSILIKTQTGVLGTNLATSAGGSGASGFSYAGGAGAVGRIRCDYYTSVSGSTTPTLSSAQDTSLFINMGSFLPFL
jgi:hypothetical protein